MYPASPLGPVKLSAPVFKRRSDSWPKGGDKKSRPMLCLQMDLQGQRLALRGSLWTASSPVSQHLPPPHERRTTRNPVPDDDTSRVLSSSSVPRGFLGTNKHLAQRQLPPQGLNYRRNQQRAEPLPAVPWSLACHFSSQNVHFPIFKMRQITPPAQLGWLGGLKRSRRVKEPAQPSKWNALNKSHPPLLHFPASCLRPARTCQEF